MSLGFGALVILCMTPLCMYDWLFVPGGVLVKKAEIFIVHVLPLFISNHCLAVVWRKDRASPFWVLSSRTGTHGANTKTKQYTIANY